MEIKEVIVVRDDLKMGKGKLAAQVAHAALEGYRKVAKSYSKVVEEWAKEGEKKIVVRVENEEKLLELYERVKKELPVSIIRDRGLTQIPSGTVTCLIIGPWYANVIDKFTGNLRLL